MGFLPQKGKPHDLPQLQNQMPPPITVSLVCVGYDLGSPIAFSNDFHESAQNNNFEPLTSHGGWILPPGFFVPLGESQVCWDILQGTGSVLEKYREVAVVQKYRKLRAIGKLDQLSTEDLIQLSRTCLGATESATGRRFDSGAFLVAAPNHYAVISQKTGFHKLIPSQ